MRKHILTRLEKLRALAAADAALRCPVCRLVRRSGVWFPYCSQGCLETAAERKAGEAR